MIEGISSHWSHYVDDKLTFCGALIECYDECSKYWKKEETRKQYAKDYNEKIFPNLKSHNSKPLNEYTKADYESAIQSIARQGQNSNPSIIIPYADSTIQHFRHLIDVVVVAASNRNLCDNVLWGSRFALSEEYTAEDGIKEYVKLKKSLTIQQEIAISKFLLSDSTQYGQYMGLLLMYAFGLRNGEACGVDFGDIKPMVDHPECKVLWVYKSTVRGGNNLQSSGKTKNADRIIPIPNAVGRFLEARKKYILDHVQFTNGEEIRSVDQLPIACINDNFRVRCSASNLTAAGREIFKSISLEERLLAYIDLELTAADAIDLPKEKDPTSYLLRRNFATHLHILGLSEAEIEYVLGHDIEDIYETRNEFVNEEKLYEIKLKMDQRPILSTLYSENTTTNIDNTLNAPVTISNQVSSKYSIPLKPGLLKIHLTAKEPSNALQIKQEIVPKEVFIKERFFPSVVSPQDNREIDIISQYHKAYRKQIKSKSTPK